MVLLPISADVPLYRIPWMNWGLMIITILVSIYVFYDDENYALAESEVERIVDYYERTQPVDLEAVNKYSRVELTREDVKWTNSGVRLDLAGPYSHPLALHPAALKWWQLVTHSVVHTGWIVLFVNMLFLFCFGNAINAKLGPIWFLLLYVLVAVLSGLFIVLAGRPVPVLGCSASIMGLMGLFLILYPCNDIRMYYWVWAGQRFNGICYLSAIWFIAGYILLDVIWVWRKVIPGSVFLADILSLVFGMAIGLILVLTGLTRDERGEENLLRMLGWNRDE